MTQQYQISYPFANDLTKPLPCHPFVSDYNTNISDIPGATATQPYYSQALHRVPKARSYYYDVSDINSKPKKVKRTDLKKYIPEPIVDRPKIAIQRHVDQNCPIYDWKGAQQPICELAERKDKYSALQKYDTTLKTNDIIGYQDDLAKREKYYGKITEVHNFQSTTDINKKHYQTSYCHLNKNPSKYCPYSEYDAFKAAQNSGDIQTIVPTDTQPMQEQPQLPLIRRIRTKSSFADLTTCEQSVGLLPGPPKMLYKEYAKKGYNKRCFSELHEQTPNQSMRLPDLQPMKQSMCGPHIKHQQSISETRPWNMRTIE